MVLQDLRLLLVELNRRFQQMETSPYVLFALLLSLLSMFADHMGWRCQIKSQYSNRNFNNHSNSNWSIHLLASQGALIHPVEIPFFAEFSIALEFEYKHSNGNLSIKFKSPWKLNEDHQPKLTKRPPNVSAPEIDWPPTGNRVKYWIQEGIKNYVYGRLDKELEERNLQIAIPAEHFYLYAQVKVQFLEKDSIQTDLLKIQKMRIRIPIRRSTPAVQIVRIKFIDFFWGQDALCSGKWFPWMELKGIGTEPLAFVKDQEVRLIYPPAVYFDDSHYMICDSFVCEITEAAQEKWTWPQPCLSAIQRDADVHEVVDACPTLCKQSNNSMLKPAVIEFGDKIYISRISHLISIHCLNSSHNQILESPPSGALEMRIRCGCALFHNFELLLNRRSSLPPTCVSNDSLDLGVFQLEPSGRFAFKKEHKHFNGIPASVLETKDFRNISGKVVARDVMHKVLKQKASETEYAGVWDFLRMAIAFLLLWGLFKIFYKICIPPWYKFLEWLDERSIGLQVFIIDMMDAYSRNHQAVLPELQPTLTAEAA